MNVLLSSGSSVEPGSVRESPNPHLHLSTSGGRGGGKSVCRGQHARGQGVWSPGWETWAGQGPGSPSVVALSRLNSLAETQPPHQKNRACWCLLQCRFC